MTDHRQSNQSPRVTQTGTRPRKEKKAPPTDGRDDSAMNYTAAGTRGSQSTKREREDKAQRTRREVLYDRFVENTREVLEAGQERGRAAFDKAVNRARDQLVAAGEFTTEQGEVFKKYLERDLEQTTDDLRALGQETKERLDPSRIGAGALSSLAWMLQASGHTMDLLSRKAQEALTYQTGELTTAGTLTCQECGQRVQLKATGHVPPCPKCHGTRFRKSY